MTLQVDPNEAKIKQILAIDQESQALQALMRSKARLDEKHRTITQNVRFLETQIKLTSNQIEQIRKEKLIIMEFIKNIQNNPPTPEQIEQFKIDLQEQATHILTPLFSFDS